MREAGTVRGRSRRSRAARCLFVGYAWIVVAFLSLPNLVVMGMSVGRVSTLEFPPRGFTLRWYERYLALPGWIDATLTSLVVGLGTAACSLVLGTLAAYALVRGRFAGRAGLRAIILLPIIVPHLVVAIALYGLFSDLRLTGTRLGFLAAHTMLATPFVVTVMVPTFQGIPVSVEQAARGLGAGRLRALWRVTLPMALPGLVASGLFAFLVSFDELLVALFLSGPEVATLPKKLWDGVQLEIEPTLAAVSTLFILVTGGIMCLAGLLKVLTARRAGFGPRTGRDPAAHDVGVTG